ncbi:hypothetical protein EYF80_004804 [Liparis tanakae]|uniref:Uncharacterized protein n=1 Tax=Liparis tanakae TaxID=230148 RepID=A0A4Z2J3F4_9TELE|nr:hypothetical protein EYF80_004804 [Liparis tanakae]
MAAGFSSLLLVFRPRTKSKQLLCDPEHKGGSRVPGDKRCFAQSPVCGHWSFVYLPLVKPLPRLLRRGSCTTKEENSRKPLNQALLRTRWSCDGVEVKRKMKVFIIMWLFRASFSSVYCNRFGFDGYFEGTETRSGAPWSLRYVDSQAGPESGGGGGGFLFCQTPVDMPVRANRNIYGFFLLTAVISDT